MSNKINPERVTVRANTTSKSISIGLHSSANWLKVFPDAVPSASFIVGSLEGEDAFTDIYKGMFEFSDNGRNPYTM